MYKSIITIFLIICGMLMINTSEASHSRDFTLYNNTNRTIRALAFAAHDSREWTLSTGSHVGPHENTTVNFNSDGPCVEEVKITLTNGEVLTWGEGFDFCEVSNLSLEANSDGTYRIVYH